MTSSEVELLTALRTRDARFMRKEGIGRKLNSDSVRDALLHEHIIGLTITWYHQVKISYLFVKLSLGTGSTPSSPKIPSVNQEQPKRYACLPNSKISAIELIVTERFQSETDFPDNRKRKSRHLTDWVRHHWLWPKSIRTPIILCYRLSTGWPELGPTVL